MQGSVGAASAALEGRGNRSTEEYQVILPHLPTGRVALNTVFLHGDVRARPYRVEDFRDALGPTGVLTDIIALGAYQINHVWAVTLNGEDATKKLLAFKELQVKGHRCLIVDRRDQQIKLRLHWLLYGVADEDVRTAFAAFGNVVEVNRERWRVDGVSDKASTTRTVLLKLKSGVTVEDLPHQVRVAGELALVVAPGRPMQCLRCKGTGHVRRDCRVPRCSICRRFGHRDAQCVRSYAAVTSAATCDEIEEQTMDAAEAEDAAKGAGDAASSLVERGPVSPEDYDTASEPEEKETAKADTSQENSTEDAQSQLVDMSTQAARGRDMPAHGMTRGINTSSAVKRSLEQSAGTAHESKVEGPPAKATPGRRSGLRARSNLPVDRPVGTPRDQQLTDAGPPDGPGDV